MKAFTKCRFCGHERRLQKFRWRTEAGALVFAMLCYDCHQKGLERLREEGKRRGMRGTFKSQWRGRP